MTTKRAIAAMEPQPRTGTRTRKDLTPRHMQKGAVTDGLDRHSEAHAEAPLINPVHKMRMSVEVFGRARNKVLVVDDFYKEPNSVRETALSLSYGKDRSVYPFVQAKPYWSSGPLARFLSQFIREKLIPKNIEDRFRIVTKKADELAPWQRVPHFDDADLAGVIYLNPPEQCRGGTGFYRHRASGLERFPENIGPRLASFMRKHGILSREELIEWVLASPGLPRRGFITESNEEWELTKLVQMKSNRLIMYDARLFHSGYIRERDFGERLETRRLTQAFFIRFRKNE